MLSCHFLVYLFLIPHKLVASVVLCDVHFVCVNVCIYVFKLRATENKIEAQNQTDNRYENAIDGVRWLE